MLERGYELNEDEKYISLEEFKQEVLYKRVVEWTPEKLILEDGSLITLETSEHDCCAGAYGDFSNVVLDAMITDVVVGGEVDVPDDDTRISQVELRIMHNQNPIALAQMEADAGNGGYYYSVGSIVINKKHFPIVQA